MGTLGARQKSWDLLGCKLSVLKCMPPPPRSSSSLPDSLYIVSCLLRVCSASSKTVATGFGWKTMVDCFGFLCCCTIGFPWNHRRLLRLVTRGDFCVSDIRGPIWTTWIMYYTMGSCCRIFISISLRSYSPALTSGCLEVLCGSIDPGEKIIIYKLE